MAEVAWIDGRLVPDAKVSVLDHGLTVGDGVFETLKAIGGAPFAVRRHLERLRASAAVLDLEVPWTDAELRVALGKVAALHRPLARLRITVTSGPGPLGPGRSEAGPTVVVQAGPLDRPEPVVATCTAPWPRNDLGPLTGAKSISLAEAVAVQRYAQSLGCSEALLENTAGRLCEASAANVFVAVDGRLCTPPLSSGCLAGVTRGLVLEVTDAVEEDLPFEVLDHAEEVFLTSTTRDVQGVRAIDVRALQAPGPLTRAAQDAYLALVARDLDP